MDLYSLNREELSRATKICQITLDILYGVVQSEKTNSKSLNATKAL